MNIDRLFKRHAEYHRKKWFPERYPDPLGEFVDDVSEDNLKQLSTRADPAAAALVLILMDLLPRLNHKEPAAAVERLYMQSLADHARPAEVMYHLRSLPEGPRMKLWEAWKVWSRQAQTPLAEWLGERQVLEHKLREEKKRALSVFAVDAAKECESIEKIMRAGRDLFDYKLRRIGTGRTLADWLSAFRLRSFDGHGDWNDFPAFARHWAELCHVGLPPSIKLSEDSAAEQRTYAVDPPSRVVLRYGEAAGPVDLLRFLQELGRSAFYCGMTPELSANERLLGDPQLPHFWSCLYAGALTTPAGIAKLIQTGPQELASQLALVFQFWTRYDCALALYRERLAPDLKQAQDLYVACWDISFAIEPPHFLFQYDLERSGDALLRVLAFRSAAAVTERLRSLYGFDWFASERCAKRLREYRREGYRLKVGDLLRDLDAEVTDDSMILSS